MDLIIVEELEEDEIMEQKYVKAQITQMDTWEEDVVETRVQPSIEVQALTETQLRVMEIDMCESDATTKK